MSGHVPEARTCSHEPAERAADHPGPVPRRLPGRRRAPAGPDPEPGPTRQPTGSASPTTSPTARRAAPSRASLLTGLWQMNHRVNEQRRAAVGPPADAAAAAARPRLRPDPVRLQRHRRSTLRRSTPTTPAAPATNSPCRASSPACCSTTTSARGSTGSPTHGYDVPEDHRRIYEPADVPIPEGRGATWRPAVYAAEHTESAFMTTTALAWLDEPGDGRRRRGARTCPTCAPIRRTWPRRRTTTCSTRPTCPSRCAARPRPTRPRCTPSWHGALVGGARRRSTSWTSASCRRPTTG